MTAPDPAAVRPQVRTLDATDDPDDALETYHRIDATAFGLRPNPAQLGSKRALTRPERSYVASIDGVDCGVAGSFATELTLPGGTQVPAAAVSDVGVLATHRRRGVLSALMSAQLGDRRAGGDAVALLHASEGSIYRRFGYGPATRFREIRIDASRFRLRDDWPEPGGSLQILQPSEALDACRQVHDIAERNMPGALTRSDAWWSVVLGDVESYLGGNPRQLVLVHRDPAGSADGYALYEVHEDWRRHQPHHRIAVWELVSTSPGVELALWQALVRHDLVSTVDGTVAVDHPLFDAAVDPRQVATRAEQDRLWLRLLDVERVLSARRYEGSGRLVLNVEDAALPAAGGTFALEVDQGVASCRRSDEAHQLSLTSADLAGRVLGDGSFRRLARVGRVAAIDPAALVLADRLFATDPVPWCWVRF